MARLLSRAPERAGVPDLTANYRGPNVSQYGWTSFEVEQVKQLIGYVEMAKKSAESSQASAKFAEDSIQVVKDMQADITNMYNNYNTYYTNMLEWYTDFDVKYQDFLLKYANVISFSDRVEGLVKLTEELYSKTEGLVLLAEKSVIKAKESADKAEASEIGSKNWYDQSYTLYEALSKGNVYRGTWNPRTNQYPVAGTPPTNSTWDVVLNPGDLEYTWNGDVWFWGDRLTYTLETDTYTHIESGTTVSSVNGKKGAVVLSAADVGAVDKAGDTITGPLTLAARSFAEQFQVKSVGSETGLELGGSKDFSFIAPVVKGSSDPLWSDSIRNYGGRDWRVGDEPIYHKGLKPTVSEIGALPSGNGTTELELTPFDLRFATRRGDGSSAGGWSRNIQFSGGTSDASGVKIGGYGSGNTIGYGFIHVGTGAQDSLNSFRVHPTHVSWGDYQIYHQGFKPSAAEIGALPLDGGVISGNISINGDVVLDASSSRGHLLFEVGGGQRSHIYADPGVRKFIIDSPVDIAGNLSCGDITSGTTRGNEYFANGWFRSTGDSGWYSEKWGGGWNMTDAQWIRSYGNKKVHIDNGEGDALNVSGGIYVGGNGNLNDVYIRSDRRLKHDIEKIDNALDKVESLTGVSYFKQKSLNDTTLLGREAGLIAQDVKSVLPEAVTTLPDSTLTISNSAIVGLLVEAIKELRSEVQELKTEMGR